MRFRSRFETCETEPLTILDRKHFLAAASTAALSATARAGVARAAPSRRAAVSHALVLSGGGAEGAYEAGIVSALAERRRLSDGERFRPYGLICGTSIGALNGWFVATGQYSRLQSAWRTMEASRLFRLKNKYVTLTRPHRFVGERIRAALRLAAGLTKSDAGVVETGRILEWMQRTIDPATPVLTPLVWAVTNLTTQLPEYFYRLPPSLAGPMPADLLASIEVTLGEDVVVRPATDDLLHAALLASASTPVIFDPVVLPMVNGKPGVYVDGGVASNACVSIARTVASNLHVVLVDNESDVRQYRNAIDIVMGSYGTMQRKLLEGELRHVYFESLAKRALDDSHSTEFAKLARESPELGTLFRDLPPVDLAYLRPPQALAAGFADFDNQRALDATFAVGEADGTAGFRPYEWRTFRA